MSGYEAASRLRRDPRLGETVLIAHTAFGTDADRAHAKEVGFDHFVGKPLDTAVLDELLATVTHARYPTL
jgi:CheY-like chemotaxis protein